MITKQISNGEHLKFKSTKTVKNLTIHYNKENLSPVFPINQKLAGCKRSNSKIVKKTGNRSFYKITLKF